MAYTGAVTVGGPADVRELPALRIAKLAVGFLDNNVYLLTCRATGTGMLVDAADEVGRLRDLVGATPLQAVFTTHRHSDHWQALAGIVAATGAAVLAHPLDAPALPVQVTQPVKHDDLVSVGEVPLRVIHLRGHTPGGVALRYDDPAGSPHLFTGDSLFPGGPGRTTNPRDFGSLMNDLEERVFGVLPDETWVYPGHGSDTTIGTERPHLSDWRARGW